jgi:F-type H+-transporting ATPase subunit delta
MKDEIIVKRYADAFMVFSRETGVQEKTINDLKNLRNIIIHDNPEFLKVLESPEISFSEKCDFIDRILNEEFHEETRIFVKLLLEKERIDKIVDIAEYIRTAYSYKGETEALLKTAYPLDLELIKTIQDRLESKFKKKFKFYIELDGDLIGGIQVVIGHTVIDSSIKGSLDELKERLMNVRV